MVKKLTKKGTLSGFLGPLAKYCSIFCKFLILTNFKFQSSTLGLHIQITHRNVHLEGTGKYLKLNEVDKWVWIFLEIRPTYFFAVNHGS